MGRFLDEASLANLEEGDCGASVLRLACYGCEPEADEGEERAEEDTIASTENGSAERDLLNNENEGVLFDEHTDASFLTLAPVGSEPGLQMREPLTGKWLDVEKGFCTEGG